MSYNRLSAFIRVLLVWITRSYRFLKAMTSSLWNRLRPWAMRLPTHFQHLLDKFFDLRRTLTNVVVFLSIRFYAIEYSFAEIRLRGKQGPFVHLNFDKADDAHLDALLGSASQEVAQAEGRRSLMTDKSKTLITINSAALAAMGVLLPRSAEGLGGLNMAILLIGLVLLLTALFLVWVFFDVGTDMVIELNQDQIDLDTTNFKKSSINDLRAKAKFCDHRTDFLVDLYRTARFYFLTGLFLVVVALASGYTNRESEREGDRIWEVLSRNSKFQERLQKTGQSSSVAPP